jgi:hypothetical protein
MDDGTNARRALNAPAAIDEHDDERVAARGAKPAGDASLIIDEASEPRTWLKAEDISLCEGASKLARRAVARIVAAVRKGTYRPTFPFVPEYEVWYWLCAVVAHPLPIDDSTESADKLRKLRIAAEVAREHGEHERADKLEREAAQLEGRNDRGGRRPDWRRGPGGFGGFVLALTGIERNDCGLSYGEIADLIYNAASGSDWLPFAPITEDKLRECGWSRNRPRGRERLIDVLRTAATIEAKAQNVKRQRGRRPSASRRS